MTREEAIITLTNTASLLRDGTRYMKPEHEKQFREAYEMAIKALEQEQQWIPCTPDTMPEPMQKVLITFEEYDQLWVTSARFIYYRKTLQWGDWDFGSCGEVKAWMPMPEPYKPPTRSQYRRMKEQRGEQE